MVGLRCRRRLVHQTLTAVGVRRGGPRQQPVQDLRQLPLQELKLGDLLAHGVQVLRHEVRQAGAPAE